MDKAIHGTPSPYDAVQTSALPADQHNLTSASVSTDPALRGKSEDVLTKQQDTANQLAVSTGAFNDAHPGMIMPEAQPNVAKVSTYKEPTAWENTKFGAKYLTSKFAQGGAEIVQGLGHLGKLIPTVGPDNGKAEKQFNEANAVMDKAATMGLDPNATTNSKTLAIAGDLLKMAPAIVGTESTGGATWYLSGVGAAAKQVDQMKADGVKFDNHSDELFVQGSGLINYLLGKAVTGTVLSKMGTGFTNDVVGTLSAEATKDLANLGAKATAEDVANVYTGKALSFIQKFNQYGMGMLKAYPKIATDFAGANLLGSGLKTGVNAMNGDRKPLGDVTGEEIVNDISSPIYNGETPARNDIGQFFKNIITSPAAGLSILHGATSVGMLFDKSPYKNAVIESLQKDGSPENVAKVKQQIAEQGLKQGWSDDEIRNTATTVDALADVTSKIPADLPTHKFHDATNLVLGRRQLEAVLQETQARKEGLDPAIASKAAPFEALLRAKVEQANDKLDELITDKSYTYSEDGGKYYKTKLGEDPIEISKDRFDLEQVENKSKPKADQSKVITETSKPGSSDTSKAPVPEPEPKETMTAKESAVPVADTSALDDLDNELESFKQSQQPTQTEEQKLDEVVKANPDRIIKATIPKTEVNNEATTTEGKETANPINETSGDNKVTFKTAKGSTYDVNEDGTTVRNKAERSDAGHEGQKGIQPASNKTVYVTKEDLSKLDLVQATHPKEGMKFTLEHTEDGKVGVAEIDKYGNKKIIPRTIVEPKTKPEVGLYPVESWDNSLQPHFGNEIKEVTNEQKTKEPQATPATVEKPSPAATKQPEATVKAVDEKPAVAEVAKEEPKYYVNLPDQGHVETPGKPLPNEHGLDLFTHNMEDVGGKGFGVTEGSTGLSLGKGATEEAAIEKAQEMLKFKTPAEIQAIIKQKHEAGLKSPRGTVEAQGKPETAGVSEVQGADTKDTEAVIAKAQATVRTAEVTSGNDAESKGVLDEIDNAIESIDKHLEDLAKSKEPEHGLKEGDKVIYEGRHHTVANTDDTGVNFRDEKTGLVDRAAVHSVVNRDMAEGKLTMDEGSDNEPEPEPTNEPPKDEKKAKRAKFEQELKDAKEAFRKTFNKAMSGVNPETIEKGIKLLAVYAKIGLHDFKEIARDLAADLGDEFRDIFEGLKASYGAFATQEATDEQLDKMTDIREVRKATIDDYLTNDKQNDTGSKPNTVDENTSAVDAGESTRGTTGDVQQRNAEELPSTKNDGIGETGNAPDKTGQVEPGRDRQPSGGSGVSTGEPGAGRGLDKPDTGREVPADTKKRAIAPADQNHTIGPNDTIVPSGPVAKFNANVDALFLLKKLEAENRNPTPAEKQQLAQFVGWGGLAKYLGTPDYRDVQAVDAVMNGKAASMYNQNYSRVNLDFTGDGPIDVTKYDNMSDLVNHIKKQLTNAGYSISPDAIRAPLLKTLLTNAEFQDAQNSTVTAYYTEKRVIQSMYNIIKQLGFTGGRVLESSAGIGHIFGMLPKELKDKTALTGYELDNITGRLLKKLYPQANITVGGFEAARTPQNSQDLVVTNVPFGPTAPYDKNFPELSKFSLHNYFIAKNLKLLKPGGIGVIITSNATMDSPSSAKFRDWVTSPEGGNSYLVGAVRLPNNVFDENAGTQVTSDILVFQKKGQVTDSALEQPFRYAKTLKEGTNANGETVPVDVNEYYIDHPENMLGDMMTVHDAGTGNRYGDGSNTTLKAPDNFNLEKELARVEKTFPKDIVGNHTEAIKPTEEPITAIDKKEGSVFTKGDKIYKVQDGEAKPLSLDAKQVAISKAYVDIKEGLLNLIKLEQSNVNAEANIDAQRKELNKDYDAFVKKHGNINGRATNFLNDEDIYFPIVSSLENISRSIDPKTGRIVQEVTKGEILNKRINFPRVEPTTAADIKDAINISLNYRTGLDIGYMARMLGQDVDEVRDRLIKDELAYENPDTGILETPEEYLSGYVRDKLRKAEIAAANDPVYKNNVTQLQKVIPEDIPSSLISYSLGSAWIPAHIYEDFAKEIFGGANVGVKYLDMAGKFLVSKGWGYNTAEVNNTYAAGGLNGIDILDDTLNNKQIIVTDTVVDENGSKRQVKNVEKTDAAQAMQVQLQEKFEEYVKDTEAVQQETERIYNDVFNGQVLRNYRIPDFKHFPGASTIINLREHQKRAVARALSESTLFAHEVGSGKTFSIITTAMEMRRLGTARKPLIGVQNSTLGDFVKDFKKLYPSAKVLAPTEKEMAADGRKKLFAKIATGDWDAIILPHSQVTMIPDDPERQKAYIREQIEEMKATMLSISDRREANKFKSLIKGLEEDIAKIDNPKSGGAKEAKTVAKKSLSIEAQMQKSLDRKVDNVLNFEQLGIDALLMDEAHKYKRLGFQTQMHNIKGIDTSRSQRSQSVLLKSRWVQEKTGGKNVNFYTGTPISNTMAEAWTMMKYLRPDVLEHMGIEFFDQFAKTFGQVVPSLEQTGGGTFKIQNRFAKFQNLPEFINAFRAVTDVVLTDDVKEFQNTDTIPKLKNGEFTKVVLPQSPELKKQIQEFKATLEWFDRLSGKEKKENSHIPLVVYNKAKQASIDLRLLNPTNVDSPQSKVNKAVDNAYNIWKETKDTKGVQMIFSDMYQSPEPKNRFLDEDGLVVNPAFGKDRFNLFEDIKKKLVARGVPADQIVIFTEPKYDKSERKKAVFADANAGKIRFLLGTTEKMGVGVNAQQKMVALHHLDAPARPMDFEQRNGRIIRQGNENKIVDVLTYGVEKTLDSSAFQRLSTKQKFINQIMNGQNLERVTEDPADESQMTFDEMMAQLSDSPYAMQKLMVDNKLSSERMKQQNFNQKIIRTNSLLRQAESSLRVSRAKIGDEIKHADIARSAFPDGNIKTLKIGDQEDVTEKFGEAADGYIKTLIDKFYDSPTHFAKGGFWLNGQRVELEVRNHEKISKETGLVINTPELYYTMPELGLLKDRWGHDLQIDSNSGTGLLTSIRGQLENVLIKPSKTQADIITEEKNIERLKQDAQAKFDTGKMEGLQKESDALKEKMIEESKKNKPDPDDPNGGGQTPAEYIKDQSNIKPALDFLDKMKADTKGKFMSSIVPIPPAVWNGAIDVMKNILKATNSTQKAIRVAAKYIVDSGGSEAQAKDFESTMAEKMAGSINAQKANVADTDETHSEDVLVKAAGELQNKMAGKDLAPNEKAFATIDLNTLTKKELHRYVEVAAVLAVDKDGVLTQDVNDLLDRVENRINPKSGTAVPPEPPVTPPGENGNLMDDESPRRRIPKKNKLPMDQVEIPESDPADNTVNAKSNYSIWGNLKDIHVRNLEQLKMYGQDMTDMSAYRSMVQLASSKAQSSVDIKLANDRITRLIGDAGYKVLREALIEGRLRGTRQRFEDYATSIKRASDNDVDEFFEGGKNSSMYNIVKSLEGYEDDENPAQTIIAMLDNGEYDDAREYLADMFANAANNVAYYDKLSNGKTFDEMVTDGEFVDPKFQQSLQEYKSFIENPFKISHETNDGIFSDALGPLNTYYPLSPVGKDAHKVVNPSKSKYVAPENVNNKFTTGSADAYSSAVSDLARKLSVSLKTNNKAAAIRALEDAGLMAKVSADSTDSYIRINDVVYEATKLPVSDARTIIVNNQAMHSPVRYVLVPTFLAKEIKPIIEGNGDEDRDPYTLFGHVMNASINIMLGGPAEAIGHSYRLLSSITNSVPYMQEWAYKNGILGHAGGLVLNNPLVKVFAGFGKVLFTNSNSEEFANDVMEMAKMGLIPEKTWTHTWSKEFATAMGIEPTQFPLPYKDLIKGAEQLAKGEKPTFLKKAFTKGKFLDFSPLLYGKNGFDLKARVTMYRLVKAMAPDATPEQHIKMQADMGQYTKSLQGRLEKFIKKNGLGPFATFSRAYYRAGIKNIMGMSPLPFNSPFTKSFEAGDKASAGKYAYYKLAQMLSSGVIGLVAYWMIIHKELTGHYPNQSTGLLKIPMPEEFKKNKAIKKYYFNKRTGAWDDISLGFANIVADRGLKAVGAYKGYDAARFGGTLGQVAEAAEIQAINTYASQYTASPAVSLGFTGVTGAAPYLTSVHNYRGQVEPSFLRKAATTHAGLQIPANLAAGFMGINGLFESANPISGSLSDDYNAEDYESGKFLKSVLNIAAPNLFTAHGANKTAYVKKNEKAIETTIKKEHAHKKH